MLNSVSLFVDGITSIYRFTPSTDGADVFKVLSAVDAKKSFISSGWCCICLGGGFKILLIRFQVSFGLFVDKALLKYFFLAVRILYFKICFLSELIPQ